MKLSFDKIVIMCAICRYVGYAPASNVEYAAVCADAISSRNVVGCKWKLISTQKRIHCFGLVVCLPKDVRKSPRAREKRCTRKVRLESTLWVCNRLSLVKTSGAHAGDVR